MPTTNYAFVYPAGTDAPNVPLHIKNLADGVDAALDTVDDRVDVVEATYSRGQVYSSASVTANSTTFGTSEVLLWSHTFTSVSNTRLYQMVINTGWTMSTGTASFRIRWAVGGSVTTASTSLWPFRMAPPVSAGFNQFSMTTPVFSGFTAGTVTVGLTAFSDGPTDGVLLRAADNVGKWDIIDMGT